MGPYFKLEPLVRFNPKMQCEVDLRNDEDSVVKFQDDIDGPMLQLAGNNCDVSILLNEDHLQSIFNQLVDYGFKTD